MHWFRNHFVHKPLQRNPCLVCPPCLLPACGMPQKPAMKTQKQKAKPRKPADAPMNAVECMTDVKAILTKANDKKNDEQKFNELQHREENVEKEKTEQREKLQKAIKEGRVNMEAFSGQAKDKWWESEDWLNICVGGGVEHIRLWKGLNLRLGDLWCGIKDKQWYYNVEDAARTSWDHWDPMQHENEELNDELKKQGKQKKQLEKQVGQLEKQVAQLTKQLKIKQGKQKIGQSKKQLKKQGKKRPLVVQCLRPSTRTTRLDVLCEQSRNDSASFRIQTSEREITSSAQMRTMCMHVRRYMHKHKHMHTHVHAYTCMYA